MIYAFYQCVVPTNMELRINVKYVEASLKEKPNLHIRL
jgi:hypothetical protein